MQSPPPWDPVGADHGGGAQAAIEEDDHDRPLRAPPFADRQRAQPDVALTLEFMILSKASSLMSSSGP